MEIVRTKSQSVALTTRISQFFDSTQNREVIGTASDFRKRNGFVFRNVEHMFTGIAALFSDELDALKVVLTRAGGSNSRSSITQVGLSNMIQYLNSFELPNDTALLDALMFVVFQIHSNDLRKGGASQMFRNLYKYLSDKNKFDKNEFLSAHTVDDSEYILINGKTLTYVCINKFAKQVKDVAHQHQHFITADTIGSMRKSLDGIDALTFMTLKSEAAHTVMLFGQTYEVGQLYYKQLAAEVAAIGKIKRANGSKVVMHGNTTDGFVRRMNDDMKKRATGLLRALDSSNAIRFITRGIGRDQTMSYLVDTCYLKEMSDSRGVCVMHDNINKLIQSKLLHDAGIGSSCAHCSSKGTMDLINQLTERNIDIIENIKEMVGAMSVTDTVAQSKPEPSVTARIVQSGGATYLTRQEYHDAKDEKKKQMQPEKQEVKNESEAIVHAPVDEQTFDIKTSGNHSYMDSIVAGVKPKAKKSF